MYDTPINKIILTPANMKRIAGYEITFKEIIEDTYFDEADIICSDVYSFTLDDLLKALKNLQTKDPTISDFYDYWFLAISNLWDAFDLDRALGTKEDDMSQRYTEDDITYIGLSVSDSAMFHNVWSCLENVINEEYDMITDQFKDCNTRLSQLININNIIADVEHFLDNKNKPINKRIFTDFEMENYIRTYEHGARIKEASEPELELCRKMIDRLIESDNIRALHIKGYACYGGNRLYEENWPVSRDCMLKLLELTDDPYYANTLGYIYYYGRCNDGVPQYDKAFEYFSIAAANGIYEGMYKLADMYSHGYGCRKSPRTAYTLYSFVYDDSYKSFINDSGNNFADAALRMGNVWAKGINVPKNPIYAYDYYLRADYAIKLRTKNHDYYGDSSVLMSIGKALAETESTLPDDYFVTYLDLEGPFYFKELINNNNRCTLTKEKLTDGNVKLTAMRLPTRSCPEPENELITIGRLKFCDLCTSFSMTAITPEEIIFNENENSFNGNENIVRFDHFEQNENTGAFEFFYDNQLTASIKCEAFRIWAPKIKKPSGPKHNFVSVCFSPNGRTYDYICDIDDVKIGDTVIVIGYNGETPVTVVNKFSKYESELGLPVDRFKKVVRKA